MPNPALTIYLSQLPLEFLRWWFLEAPLTILKILQYIFAAAVHLFSFKELFTTFLRPWKNEYREGLVRTAVFIGAFIKTGFILFDLLIFGCLLAFEMAVFVAWLSLPFIIVIALYGSLFS